MSIKILQWNIWYKENPGKVVEEIKRLKPDIVCLQELIRDSRKNIDTAEYIGKELKFNYFYKDGSTWDNRQDKEAQGNAIFSRLPIKNNNFLYLQDFLHNPPDARHEGRVYVEITIEAEGRELIIGTTHLSYSSRFKLNNLRIKEADRLFNVVRKKKGNYILAGDLNTIPKDRIIENLSNFLKNIGPDYSEKTWTTKPFKYWDGFEENDLNWRLDHVLATPDVETIGSEITQCKYSDHLPILVEIK